MDGKLRILYRKVPLGHELQGYSGLSWFLMREGMGSPIELEVLVEGHPAGTVEHLDADGWKRFEFKLAGADRSADIEFRVSSDSFIDRDFCFHASVK